MNVRHYIGNKWEWNDRQWRSVGCQFNDGVIDATVLYTTEDDDVYSNTALYLLVKELKKKHVYEVPDGWVGDAISKSMYKDDIVGYLKGRVYARAGNP